MVSGLSIDSKMYMNLLVEQLKHQDPEEPISNSDMVAQMAQLANVEALNTLNASFSEVLKLTRLQDGVSLVGRGVEYMKDGTPAYGVVDAISTEDDTIRLLVQGEAIELGMITKVF